MNRAALVRAAAALLVLLACLELAGAQSASPTTAGTSDTCYCRINKKCSTQDQCLAAGKVIGGIVGGIFGGGIGIMIIGFCVVGVLLRKKCMITTISSGKGSSRTSRRVWCFSRRGCCSTPAYGHEGCIEDDYDRGVCDFLTEPCYEARAAAARAEAARAAATTISARRIASMQISRPFPAGGPIPPYAGEYEVGAVVTVPRPIGGAVVSPDGPAPVVVSVDNNMHAAAATAAAAAGAAKGDPNSNGSGSGEEEDPTNVATGGATSKPMPGAASATGLSPVEAGMEWQEALATFDVSYSTAELLAAINGMRTLVESGAAKVASTDPRADVLSRGRSRMAVAGPTHQWTRDVAAAYGGLLQLMPAQPAPRTGSGRLWTRSAKSVAL